MYSEYSLQDQIFLRSALDYFIYYVRVMLGCSGWVKWWFFLIANMAIVTNLFFHNYGGIQY